MPTGTQWSSNTNCASSGSVSISLRGRGREGACVGEGYWLGWNSPVLSRIQTLSIIWLGWIWVKYKYRDLQTLKGKTQKIEERNICAICDYRTASSEGKGFTSRSQQELGGEGEKKGEKKAKQWKEDCSRPGCKGLYTELVSDLFSLHATH